MKFLILPFLFCFSSISFGQLMNGRLLEDERKLISKSDFTIQDQNQGVLMYELGVNRLGSVTSVRLINEGTTITSTPTRVKAKNYLMTLKFQEGTYYPEFHHVIVKITTRPTTIEAPKN
jgi:hypothetical protein